MAPRPFLSDLPFLIQTPFLLWMAVDEEAVAYFISAGEVVSITEMDKTMKKLNDKIAKAEKNPAQISLVEHLPRPLQRGMTKLRKKLLSGQATKKKSHACVHTDIDYAQRLHTYVRPYVQLDGHTHTHTYRQTPVFCSFSSNLAHNWPFFVPCFEGCFLWPRISFANASQQLERIHTRREKICQQSLTIVLCWLIGPVWCGGLFFPFGFETALHKL